MKSNFVEQERRLAAALGLNRRPVAVTFADSIPPGIAAFAGSVPAGCSFWKIAAEGKTFHTIPGDHFNCAVGSHTHNIALPEARAHELGDTLTLMSGLGYIRMEEVPGILQLPNTPAAIIFAPLADSPVVPDAVIVCAKSAQLMLLTEAAGRAKSWSNLGMLFRPTCMGLPAALKHGTVASAGCIGNRVYTGIGDDESYMFVPGRDLEKVIDELDTIVEANARLSEFHRGRLESLTVS